jgi:hypothetical protein
VPTNPTLTPNYTQPKTATPSSGGYAPTPIGAPLNPAYMQTVAPKTAAPVMGSTTASVAPKPPVSTPAPSSQSSNGQLTPEQLQVFLSLPESAKASYVTGLMSSGGMKMTPNGGTSPSTGNVAPVPPVPYVKNPEIDKLSRDQQLAYYAANPTEAKNEIARAKDVWNSTTDPTRRQGANEWADALRQAAGINMDDANYGNGQSSTSTGVYAPQNPTLNSATGQTSGNPIGQPTGQTGGQTGGQPTGQTGATQGNGLYKDPYARNDSDIAALAKARIDKILQAGRTSAQGSLASARNAFDYTKQITNDNRTLQTGLFNETNNPFSGKTTYDKAMMERNRSIEDTATNKDYNANVAQIQQKLADLESAAPGDEQQIIDDLRQMERQFGISVAQLQEQQKNNQFNQMDANRKFDYGVGQDQIRNDIAKAGLTGNYQDSAQVNTVKKQMAANSAAYASATPAEQKRLHDENVRLAESIGGMDTTGSGDYKFGQGQRTLAGQTLDLNNAKDNRDFQYQTVQDAIKNGMSQQQIDNSAKQFAQQMGYNYDNMNANDKQAWAQIAISQQNANTSSDNANWSKDPTNPDNIYKNAQIQSLTTKGDQKLQDESKGLVEALRGGKMTPGAAVQQIDEDMNLGFYTKEEAAHLKSIITTITPNLPVSANQQQLTPEQQAAIPSNAELDKLYKTEGNGAPFLDWKSWYKDPKGKSAGVNFATWKQLYGPTLSAGK